MLAEEIETKIREIVEAENPEAFILDIELHRSKRSILRIILDTDEGITLDQCTSISRKVGRYLDESEAIESRFNLEVTSPGLDRPLTLERQYKKNVGRRLEVELNSEEKIEGKLLGVNETGIRLQPEPSKKNKKKTSEAEAKTEIDIQFEKIKQAKVLVSFR